jgi:hypothetical protein
LFHILVIYPFWVMIFIASKTEERLQSMLLLLNNQYQKYYDRLDDFVDTFIKINMVNQLYSILITTHSLTWIKSKVSLKDCKQAISTTADILERIIRKPDDVACRKLRVSHPTLQARTDNACREIDKYIMLFIMTESPHRLEWRNRTVGVLRLQGHYCP